ncbi:(Fe-S)-binding protein [Aquifex aeolicus]|uniref:Heterodisulfide reductase n=1 Tax=Aquifex aeolicus (strain VF5) TaxID=224324 RepID=O67093_AQUAE|nr:(Fe-S)-binding protein [Aquifex aeolicus]AAC07045.1 heterodisulfide reductase [Aquifex aeolicus VF5]
MVKLFHKEKVSQEDIKKFYNFCKSSINSEVAAYLEACVRCGLCAEACHFYMGENISGKIDPTLTPAYKADLLREIYKENYTLWGRIKKLFGFGVKIKPEDLYEQVRLAYYTCTMCDRCTKICPMGIDTPMLVGIVRGALTQIGLTPEDLVEATNRAIEQGSPLGVDTKTFLQRIDFISDEWEVEMPVDQPAEYLYIPSSIELMKYPESVAAAAKILNKSGVKWTLSTVAHEATNFGMFVQDKKVIKELLERILKGAKELGIKTIISPECGHAYQAIRFVAPNVFPKEWDFEVLNVVEFIKKMLDEGRIKLNKKVVDVVTLHDSCQIGRRGGVLREPREILTHISQKFVDSVEFPEKNICCGGGGGVVVVHEADEHRRKAFLTKMELFDKAGTKNVACYCANCMLALEKSSKELNRDYKFLSLVELVAEALEDEE